MELNLGKYLAQALLETGMGPKVALFPGDFKPPHKGHFKAVEKLLKATDQVVILVSPQIKDGITADEAVDVWNLYKPLLDGSVEVKITTGDPVEEARKVIENNPDSDFIVAFGKNNIDRYRNMEKQDNVKIFDAGDIEITDLKSAINQEDEEKIKSFIPDGIDVSKFLSLLGKKQKEKPAEEKPAETPPSPTPTPNLPEDLQLQESPPINFEDDPYQDYILQNRRKIEQASYVFNIPINDMEFAFNGGMEVVLNDDMWKEMENTKSYNIKTLEDAISHSLKLGIDPKPYIDHIKQKKEIPLPLVLQFAQDKYYLVGGEVILSIYRSLGVIPTVLLATLNLQDKKLPRPMNESLDKKKLSESQTGTLGEFIKYAIQNLGIQQPPTGLTLSYNTKDAQQRSSFGTFDTGNNKIWLYVGNRNMADILRTLAHELVHRKQAEDGRLDITSGETGSEIENEANAQAGILLRNFGKTNKHIYEQLLKEGVYGDYLFGDKDSGVNIGWYKDEIEEDTPAESRLFVVLKRYADSEAETYSNISLDNLIPTFKKIKKQYPEIGEAKVSGYLYRGTAIPEEKAKDIMYSSKTIPYDQGFIALNQTYSSRRKVSSWSTEYFPAAGFAVTTAERKGGIPVVMRAKSSDAELFFNPKFMEKLSTQLEDETFNITNPIPVDIMFIENYKDEFEDIESGYLSTK
jgi:hypothetical protein